MAGRSTFGQDGIRWTIPSSRCDNTPIIALPGPGAYNVPVNPNYRRLRPSFPRAPKNDDDSTLTSGVDFINHPFFPSNREAHIGVRGETQVATVIITPGPSYMPETRDTRLPHTIRSRSDTGYLSDTANLGPGSYEPQFCYLPRDFAFSFTGPKERCEWMINRQGIPGPGHYQTMLKEAVPKDPQWTIGRKSRFNRRDRTAVPNRPKDLLVVDQIIVDLDVLANPASAREYAATHPALRHVVREVFDMVYRQKPENPLQMLREFFSREKELGGGVNEFAD
jgi:hypothetical protein